MARTNGKILKILGEGFCFLSAERCEAINKSIIFITTTTASTLARNGLREINTGGVDALLHFSQHGNKTDWSLHKHTGRRRQATSGLQICPREMRAETR